MSDDKTYKRVEPAPTRKSTNKRSLPEIAGFEVNGVQGEGGMATVFRAVDRALDRRVAIKMMSPELGDDSEFRMRFRNEAKIVAQFRHPNIVSVYASGEIDSGQYIVMEFVDGGNLDDRLESGKLNDIEAVDVGRQMADALSYSHARRIIHRDFKPANILFTKDNTPVLSDFGVAKSTSTEKTAMTKIGIAIGSLSYMAPEQRRGETVTDRIDVYSFGLVLYEMLTGTLPAGALRDAEVERQLRSKLGRRRRNLADLICRCLQQDPELRPSAEECKHVLQGIHQSMRSAPGYIGSWVPGKTPVLVASIILIAALGLVSAYLGVPPFSSENPVRTLLGRDTPVTAAKSQSYDLVVNPQDTTVYIDGVRHPAGTYDFVPGEHTVIAVAPNHFGKILNTQLIEGQTEIRVELDEMSLPTQDELHRFVSAIDSPRVMDGDLQLIADPALRQALELKRLSDNGDSENFEQLENQLETLASYDDQASIVTLYLAAETELLDRPSSSLLPRLQTVISSGYALATFWYAIWLSQALTDEDFLSRSAEYLQYCDAMRLAFDQGLKEVARPYLEQGCSLSD